MSYVDYLIEDAEEDDEISLLLTSLESENMDSIDINKDFYIFAAVRQYQRIHHEFSTFNHLAQV